MENQPGFFSRKLRAGNKRSYFFDVKATKQGDYFVTITESKRRYDRPGYDAHKIFLYKEDFKAFKNNLEETLNHIKTELNPDFDYDNYDREVYSAQVEAEGGNEKGEDRKPRSERTKSDVRSGSYLDKYEDAPAKPKQDAPKLDNDTADADAMEF